MSKFIWQGQLPPDAPEYKEGWSIHIGPLYGSRPDERYATQSEHQDDSDNSGSPTRTVRRRRRKRGGRSRN